MTIRWDEEQRVLSVSVRDLAEEGSRFGSMSVISMKRRAQMGRIEHERHQAAQAEVIESYRREQALSWRFEYRDRSVLVQGRMDGLFLRDDRLVLEEIKTLLGNQESLDQFELAHYPDYVRQLQLYRWLIDNSLEDPKTLLKEPPERLSGIDLEIDLELLIIALPERLDRAVSVPYDGADCEAFVHRRLDEIIELIEHKQRQRERRRALLEHLRFPFDRARPFQQELCDGLIETFEDSRSALVSAATGIGKTAASLVAALKRALSLGGRVFVCSSKTTQQQIFVDTIKRLVERGLAINAVVLTAREKICQNEVLLCHPEACPYAKDYEDKLIEHKVAEQWANIAVMQAQDFVGIAQTHTVCPYFMAFDALRDADVIIGDYNYVFDPGAAVRSIFGEGDASDVVLVIDEAHNLVDRGRDYYSPEISRDALYALGQELAFPGQNALDDRIHKIVKELDGLLRRLSRGEDILPEETEAEESQPEARKPSGEPSGEPSAEAGPLLLFEDPILAKRERKKAKKRAAKPRAESKKAAPEPTETRFVPKERCVTLDLKVFEELRRQLEDSMISIYIERAQGRRTVPEEDLLGAFHRSFSRFVTVLEMLNKAFSVLYKRMEQGGTLKILCKDPSGPLGARLRECAQAVALSATLTPFDFYQRMLGFPETSERLDFRSPFPPEHRCVVIDDRVTTRYQRRDAERPMIARIIKEFAHSRRGNMMVCFPSYATLQQTAPLIEPKLKPNLLIQHPRMSDAERKAVLERLAVFDPMNPSSPPPSLLLAVQGGIFTEGVDYPGELCIGVMLVGPALPKVCFERRLIQAYFDELDADREQPRGFDYAYLYPGMNRAIQAAGRVHRREADAGVIVLLGRRFLDRRYANLLPKDYYRKSPRELRSGNLRHSLRQFWESIDRRLSHGLLGV